MSIKTQTAYANTPVTLYTQADAGFTSDSQTFLGWSTQSNAATATYVGGQTATFTSDVDLYAIWKDNDINATDISKGKIAVDADKLDEDFTKYSKYYSTIKQLINNSSTYLSVICNGAALIPNIDYMLSVVSENGVVDGAPATIRAIGINDYSGTIDYTIASVPRSFIIDIDTTLDKKIRLGAYSNGNTDVPIQIRGSTPTCIYPYTGSSVDIDWNSTAPVNPSYSSNYGFDDISVIVEDGYKVEGIYYSPNIYVYSEMEKHGYDTLSADNRNGVFNIKQYLSVDTSIPLDTNAGDWSPYAHQRIAINVKKQYD